MNAKLKKVLIAIIPYMERYYGYRHSLLPRCSYFSFVFHNICSCLGDVYWPVEKNCKIICREKIYVGKNSNIGRVYSYLQGMGGIYVGDYVILGPGVGLMTSNHDLYVQTKHHEKPIIIGDYCWIGRNANITAGVTLGTRTIVGAGAVVTKSFPDGYCVIAGNPAKVVKYLNKDQFVPYHYSHEYYGYLTEKQFQKYKKKFLKLSEI